MRMRVAVMADLHIAAEADQRQRRYRAQLQQAIAAINSIDAAVVLIAGDLTQNGSPAEMRAFHAELSALKPPVLSVPGNHDVGDAWTTDNPISCERVKQYEQASGEIAFVRSLDGLRVIGLTSSLYGSGLAREEEQWQFLQASLAAPFSGWTLLLQHHPLYVNDQAEPASYWNVSPAPRARLLELLSQTGACAVVAGHLHRPHVQRVQNSSLLTAPPVSFGLPAGKQPEGWLQLDFDAAGNIAWTIHSVGEVAL